MQKRIEDYFKTRQKYYQRKDKYYTNRKFPKKDIIKLPDLAKYINTIYLKNPSLTRNNPSKLLSGKKYETIFKTNETDQDYERYGIAYYIYKRVLIFNKGSIKISDNEFNKDNFIHHIAYITTCNKFKNIDYTPEDLSKLTINSITKEDIDLAYEYLICVIESNDIRPVDILKNIKQKDFLNKLNNFLSVKYNS